MLNTIIEVDGGGTHANDGGMDAYDGVLVVECLLAILIGTPRSVDCLECLMIRRSTTNHRRSKGLSVAYVHPLESPASHRSGH